MLVDTWLIFKRDLTLSLRNPAWVLIGVMQPLVYLFLFGPLLVHVVANTPGFPPGNAWTVLTPGLIVMTATFNGAFASSGLLVEYRAGVLDRFRVTPLSGMALLMGKVLANAVQAIAQALLLIVVVLLVFDLDASFGGVAISLIIVFLLCVTLASASNALAMGLKNESALPPLLNLVLMPLMLLSGLLIPITEQLAPAWLYTLARFNPFLYVVEAVRAAFQGDLNAGVLMAGGGVLALMTVLTVIWGGRSFQKLTV
jgi:ABC-2 type transport system permease protein